MEEVIKFLMENPIQYLATVGKEGNPSVRPFKFMLEKEGKIFFCTSNKKDVYQEIINNPNVEICTSSAKYAWIRLSGKVVFSKDLNIKKEIIDRNELIRSIYKTPDDPVFEIFYLENAKAVIADLSGEPPRFFFL